MTVRRIVLLVTGLAVAGLGGVLAVSQRDQANRISTVVSALVAVAALGVAVWAALPGTRPPALRVSGTGSARAGAGSTATSGLTGPATGLRGQVEVEQTGPADATGGGDANTGVRLT